MASRVEIAIQDILTQHKSTGEPVSRLISKITRSRGLGSKERELVADSVFDLLRLKPWPEWFSKRISKEQEQVLRTRPEPNIPIELPGETLWIDQGSQIIAQKIKAKPGERVLDLCAGAGGKTKLILSTGAHITAVDISDKRLVKMPGIKRIVADGRTLSLPAFDWILIDAPCSGTGTLRRAPDIFGRLSESDISRYVQLQKELVANAVKLLKHTGKLIYATCSLLEEENHTDFDGLELIESQHLEDGFFVAVFKLS
ncbi:MAG: RsmB/NOP family class I SAM-dependent RNA methyltransferase [Myxococcaceae bacterium]